MDSLEQALAQTSNDSLAAEYLSLLFSNSVQVDLGQAKSYLKRADEAVDANICPCCYLTHRSNWGVYYQRKGELQKAKSEFLEVLKENESFDCNPKRLFGTYLNLGDVYRRLGDLPKAVEYASLSNDVALRSGNDQYKLGALNNLGIVYFHLKQYDEAAKYYRKALEIAEKTGRNSQVASIQLNLGNISYMSKDYAGARQAFESALEIAETTNDSARLPSRYINVGLALYALEDLDRAMQYLQKGLECARMIGNQKLQANAWRNMGSVAAAQKNWTASIRYIRQSLEYYEAAGVTPSLLRAYPDLAKYYREQGDYLRAYETQKIYTQLLDSISQKRLESELAKQMAIFESGRLQAENDSIQSALMIEAQAGKIKDLELSRYFFIVIGLIGTLCLVVILVILIVRANRLKQNLRVAESEQVALRARMNPHFLFNALNSIQNAILNRDKMVAYEYHAKFSELMRMVLMHSEQKRIKLSEEIRALRLYLDLEQFRTGNGFTYMISLAESINLESQEIPSMLLQPFVENAIWHGVLNRESPGTIRIRIAPKASFLECTIEDDGIGREAAYRLHNQREPGHESVALRLTENRLELLKQQYGKQIGLQITDKYLDGQATGTLVELTIPTTISV